MCLIYLMNFFVCLLCRTRPAGSGRGQVLPIPPLRPPPAVAAELGASLEELPTWTLKNAVKKRQTSPNMPFVAVFLDVRTLTFGQLMGLPSNH